MRLIDANNLEKSWDVLDTGEAFEFYSIEEIENAPTVLDATEIVCCKDCKHKQREYRGSVYCDFNLDTFPSDWFCPFGEQGNKAICFEM